MAIEEGILSVIVASLLIGGVFGLSLLFIVVYLTRELKGLWSEFSAYGQTTTEKLCETHERALRFMESITVIKQGVEGVRAWAHREQYAAMPKDLNDLTAPGEEVGEEENDDDSYIPFDLDRMSVELESSFNAESTQK